jgi:ATP-binding cassette subfamily B protein
VRDLTEPFAFAVVTGEWNALVGACTTPPFAVDSDLLSDELADAVVEERQRLGLESGADFERWLAMLEVTPDEWLDDLVRRCAGAGSSSGTDAPRTATPNRTAWVAALVGGWFERWECEVARNGAALQLRSPAVHGDDDCRARARDGDESCVDVDGVARAARGTPLETVTGEQWALVVAAVQRGRHARRVFAQQLPHEDVAAAMALRRLDWTRYRFAVDGSPNGVVDVWGDQLPHHVAGIVHSTPPGSFTSDVDGRPLSLGVDGQTVAVSLLVERRRPRPDDPEVRALVADDLLDRHLKTATATTTTTTATEATSPGPAQATTHSPSTATPPLGRETRHRRRRHTSRRGVVMQVDSDDCATACLVMVARSFGRRPSLLQLRDACETGGDSGGTSLAGIVDAAASIGVQMEARLASPPTLAALPTPFIAHWNGDHWIVVDDVDDELVDIRDPAVGAVSVPLDEFIESWTGYAAVPVGLDEPAVADGPPLRASSWLRPLIRPLRWSLALALALTAGLAAAGIAIPLLSQRVIDGALSSSGPHPGWAIAMALTLLVSVLLDLLRRRVLVETSARLDADMLDHVTARLLTLPPKMLMRRRTGDLERRLLGLAEVRRVIVEQGIDAITAATVVVLAGAALVVVAPLTAALLVLSLPAYVLLARRSQRTVRPLFAAMEQAFGRYTSGQLDLLRGIETVKVHGAEQPSHERLSTSFARLRRRIVPARRAAAGIDVATTAVGSGLYAAAVIVGAQTVADDSVGTLVAALGLIALAVPAMTQLAQAWDDVQMSAVLLERVRDVLERPLEPSGAVRPGTAGAITIRLDGVAVRHHDRDVLRRVDLTIAAGTTVAVVGRSGSGKSTLLRVIAGLERPTTGVVRIEEVALHDVDPDWFRSHLGAVLQEPYVFTGTIADNVAFRSVGDERSVWEALRIACLDETVERLPFGLSTLVGEGGLPLAGGERQRLALARAVHDRPSILVLDEPTSALDPVTEEMVRANLATLGPTVSTVLATHRLRIAADADLIVVLDAGVIVERGTHAELLHSDGLYAHLCRQQGLDDASTDDVSDDAM